jgi:hypothetical protein
LDLRSDPYSFFEQQYRAVENETGRGEFGNLSPREKQKKRFPEWKAGFVCSCFIWEE